MEIITFKTEHMNRIREMNISTLLQTSLARKNDVLIITNQEENKIVMSQ